MSHNKFDAEIKSLLGDMDNGDASEALGRKEEVWSSLEINRKKPKPNYWIMLLLLGLMLLIGGVFLRNMYFGNTEPDREAIMPNFAMNELEMQFDDMKDQLKELKLLYGRKDDVIDSLIMVNKDLNVRIQDLAGSQHFGLTKEVVTINVRDTIYLKDVEKEEVIRERIVRDTVFIEIPILTESDELITDNNNSINLPDESYSAEVGNSQVKRKPTSIQFNFSKIKNDK